MKWKQDIVPGFWNSSHARWTATLNDEERFTFASNRGHMEVRRISFTAVQLKSSQLVLMGPRLTPVRNYRSDQLVCRVSLFGPGRFPDEIQRALLKQVGQVMYEQERDLRDARDKHLKAVN